MAINQLTAVKIEIRRYCWFSRYFIAILSTIWFSNESCQIELLLLKYFINKLKINYFIIGFWHEQILRVADNPNNCKSTSYSWNKILVLLIYSFFLSFSCHPFLLNYEISLCFLINNINWKFRLLPFRKVGHTKPRCQSRLFIARLCFVCLFLHRSAPIVAKIFNLQT